MAISMFVAVVLGVISIVAVVLLVPPLQSLDRLMKTRKPVCDDLGNTGSHVWPGNGFPGIMGNNLICMIYGVGWKRLLD
jgi:hypothetical protein